MEINTLDIFILLRSCCRICLLSPRAKFIVMDGAKLLFKMPAKLMIAFGIVFATDSTPIAAGLIKRFASRRSKPVINILPHWFTVFQIPEKNISFTAYCLKSFIEKRSFGIMQRCIFFITGYEAKVRSIAANDT